VLIVAFIYPLSKQNLHKNFVNFIYLLLCVL
jgi:hypothetical protein